MTLDGAARTPAGTTGSITVVRNGPFLVAGSIPLSRQAIGIDAAGYSCAWRETHRYPAMEKYALCRCGKSKNKPFCDGSHAAARFDGTEKAARASYADLAQTWEGPALDLADAPVFCAEARFCQRAGGIWNLIRHSDDARARAVIEAEARLCPSGRLVVRDKDGNASEPTFEPSIAVVEDPQERLEGPLWVRGGIPVIAADGYRYEIRNRVTLCRCGRSANQPFCDGSHCER